MAQVNNASDEALMQRYQKGKADAFALLYARHKAPLYRLMLRSCESHAVAEELFQEVWISLIKAAPHYQPTAKFSTWLYSIANNRLIDHYRKQSRWDVWLVDEDAESCAVANPSEQPEQQAEVNREMQRLLQCLDTLPPPQRQVFLLKEEAGLSIQAIADSLDEGMEAIKSRMRYALKKLRVCMGGES